MQSVKEIIAAWPQEPRESAEHLIEQYGEPAEFSASLLIWRNTPDGWKRTELSNVETEHNFPAPHKDFLEQFIDYKVPVGKFSDLARFDGSVVVDRTRGEMSARCGGTSMNFVAINLAHDICAGRREVDLARQEYACLYDEHQRGEKSPYSTGFQFELPTEPTADPDCAALSTSA